MRQGLIRTTLWALREGRRDRRLLASAGDLTAKVVDAIYSRDPDDVELVHRVPALEHLEEEVRRQARRRDPDFQAVDRQLSAVVGPGATTEDVVGKSRLAYQIAIRYLDAIAGREGAGDVRKPLWGGQFKAPK